MTIRNILPLLLITACASHPKTKAAVGSAYPEALRLAEARQAGQQCASDPEAYLSTVLGLVDQAIQEAPHDKAKILKDSKLGDVRQTVQFQLWNGDSLTSDKSLKKLLSKTVWYPNSQLYNTGILRFQGHGHYVLDQGKSKTAGKYKVKGGVIELAPSKRKFQVTKVKDYEYSLNEVAADGKSTAAFWDEPSECGD